VGCAATPNVGDIAIASNGSTGWHTHQGEIYGVGAPITDPTGSDHVHIARNLGTTPVVLEVTYVDPAGAPTSDSAPNPGCEFA
jgi:hypothetical protein